MSYSKGKKRKLQECVDLESEKTLYSQFVCAANSISHLYSGSIQQQRKASAHASRQTLERILHTIVKDFGTVDAVPKAALFSLLQQEYENVEGSEHLPHSFPVQLFPQPHSGPVQTDESLAAAAAAAASAHSKRHHQQQQQHPQQPTGTTHNMVSPLNARRGHSSYSHAADSAMEVAENNQQEPHRPAPVPLGGAAAAAAAGHYHSEGVFMQQQGPPHGGH